MVPFSCELCYKDWDSVGERSIEWAEQFLHLELPLKEREEMKVRKFFEWIGAVN